MYYFHIIHYFSSYVVVFVFVTYLGFFVLLLSLQFATLVLSSHAHIFLFTDLYEDII